MTEPLRPLGLDDLRVAEPDRDSDAAFSPSETWAQACAAVANGHPADDVAGLLLELDDDELADLQDEAPHEVDANGAALALCRALAVLHSDRWTPHISRASVFDLLDERERLGGLLGELLQIHGDDDGETTAVAIPNHWLARAREALR